MGLLDGVFGGIVGSAMTGVISHVLERNGGVQGIVNQFEQKGLGPTVRSWVGTGANQPVTGDQIHQVLGSSAVQELAQKAGLSVPDLTAKLAQLLPQAIDKLTPAGTIPKA
jgi:uncharacterized protein YidB (DUF937 family)